MTDADDWVYGVHAVTGVLTHNPGRVRVVYLQRSRRDARLEDVRELARSVGVRVDLVDRRRLDQHSDGPHQGVVAQCHGLELAGESQFESAFAAFPQPRLLLLLDGVTDPRNLGACLRTACAAGVQAVLLPKRRSAPLNSVALKTAAGGAEGLMLVQVTNLARRMNWLRDQGVWVIGATTETSALWSEVDYGGDVAMVLGSEDKGLRSLTAKSCDQLVGIPMTGAVASLNVSVATGVLLFEVLRQRRLRG
jgi:23S rRNA (guanosine2251-2'-O)-methyltransferase